MWRKGCKSGVFLGVRRAAPGLSGGRARSLNDNFIIADKAENPAYLFVQQIKIKKFVGQAAGLVGQGRNPGLHL